MAKPELRFPEFADEWKEYRISEVFDRVVNPVTVEKNKYYKQIGIRSHGKGLFYKEEVTGEELGNKRVFWVEPDCFVVNIVFAWERAVAKLTEAERGMIASHRFPMYKPKDQVLDLDYITEYFTTFYGQKILILASPGGAGRNKTLGQDEFLKSRIKLPSYVEQKKIAEFLFSMDGLIQVLEEEVAVLEEQKKGTMQKLFNREVRFKADDGSEYPEWKNKKLLELCDLIMDGDWIESDDQSESGIRLIQTGNIGLGVFHNKRNRAKYISEETFNRLHCKEVLIGDILVSRLPDPAGRCCIVPDVLNSKMVTAVDCTIIRINKSNFHKYVAQYMGCEKYFSDIKKMLAGGTRQRISRKNLEQIIIPTPCYKEQQKIADCLIAYDEAIQIKKDKLEVWKEIKKGLLQQMFV